MLVSIALALLPGFASGQDLFLASDHDRVQLDASLSRSSKESFVLPETAGKVAWGTEPIKVSDVYAENLLPSFFFMAGEVEGGSYVNTAGYTGGLGAPRAFDPPNHCPADIFEATMEDLRVPVMPYLEQDDWGCERALKQHPVIVLENVFLRAAITPQWGGKVWSLYHKGRKRQLFFNNPAHQPENIAIRKAWSSGGAEWNWAPGYVGHSVFSEDAVHAAKISTQRGDVVRIWEYDRLNHTVWQVDIMLEGEAMYAHVTITNSGETEVKGYWWTCVAMKVTEESRVVLPAHDDITPCVEWPLGAYTLPNTEFKGPNLGRGNLAWQQDMSWLGNIPKSHDFFMHGWRPMKQYPLSYIVLADEDGFSVAHAHGKGDKPDVNNGTKFFTWGMDMAGKFQCDFMSASDYENTQCLQNPGTFYNYYDPSCPHYEHLGQYTELQTGPAHSQMHTFPVPAGSTVSWTEVFKGWQPNRTRMKNHDYFGEEGPVGEVESWLNSREGLPFDDFKSVDRFLEDLAKVPPKPDEMLYYGQPWGALHEKLVGKDLAPGAPFFKKVLGEDPRSKMWVELLDKGTFSSETLQLIPTSFQVLPAWAHILAESLLHHPATWLHHLLLATAALEEGYKDVAQEGFEQSMLLKPNVHAARNLAVIASTTDTRLAHYSEAWSVWLLWPRDDPSRGRLGRNLASEISIWLTANTLWDPLRRFLAALPSACDTCLDTDRTLHARAALEVHDGKYEEAMKILSTNCFPTYGSDRQLLINLWYESHLQMERARLGRALTRADVVSLRSKIGCDGDSTTRIWTDPCVRGPPNLGIAYR